MTDAPKINLEVVGVQDLQPVARQTDLKNYLRNLWGRRHFIIADSRARVVSSTQQMILGRAWLIIKPLLDVMVYLVIFGLILKTSRGIDNFLSYLIIGVFLFSFTTRSLSNGGNSIVNSKALIHAFSFPRAALPAAVVLREVFSMVPVLATMFVLIMAVPAEFDPWTGPPGADLSWRWLLFPLIFFLQTIFNFGIALIAARLVAKVRDLTHVIALFSRFWFYGSGVFFTLDRYVTDGPIRSLLEANPLFLVLDMSRDVLIYAETPELKSWLILAAWTVTVSVLGFLYFWRGEEKYGSVQ